MNKTLGVKQFIKEEAYIWRFEFAKSWRRKYAQWQKYTADYYFPHKLRTLYFGTGTQQLKSLRTLYFGTGTQQLKSYGYK